jgi:hypothetical protein
MGIEAYFAYGKAAPSTAVLTNIVHDEQRRPTRHAAAGFRSIPSDI